MQLGGIISHHGSDTNDMYNTFLDYVLELYNKHYPVYNKCKSPWLSNGIYNSIRRKKYLYKKIFQNPTSLNKSMYTLYK